MRFPLASFALSISTIVFSLPALGENPRVIDHNMVYEQPDYVVDGPGWELNSNVTQIACTGSFRFVNGSRLIVRGTKLLIKAGKLEGTGTIIYQPDPITKTPSAASNGTNGPNGKDGAKACFCPGQAGGHGGQGRTGVSGAPGRSGPLIAMYFDRMSGHLLSDLRGQDAQPGQNAGNGGTGGRGGKGGEANSGFFSCAQGPGWGGNGGNGGNGGTGGNGGNGGKGGDLYIGYVTENVAQIDAAEQKIDGGKGAPGGAGGGAGGAGAPGDGGDGDGFCSGANSSRRGKVGKIGKPGSAGAKGNAGLTGSFTLKSITQAEYDSIAPQQVAANPAATAPAHHLTSVSSLKPSKQLAKLEKSFDAELLKAAKADEKARTELK